MVAMSDRKQKFAHETELEPAAVITLLEELVAGLRSGELSLTHGEQAIALRLDGPVEVALAAKRKPGRESLRLELEWSPRKLEPVLEIGPARDPAPLEARRRGVVALREARLPAGPPPAPNIEHPLDPKILVKLPKERLYALAKAIELDGRSQLHKSALARALAEHDLRPHLDAEDRRMLAEHGADTTADD